MKKLVLLTVAMLFMFSTVAFSQGMVTGLTGKGVKVGLDMANFTGDDVSDAKMKLGIVGGGFITYAFSDLFAIQPELIFSMKGAKYEPTGGSYDFKLNYIEIPVLAKVLLAGGGNFKPNFYAGPAIGFLLSAKSDTTDVKDITKSTDFGLIGGAGADLHMGTGPGKITFDIRYEVGLTSIDDSGADAKINNSTISFLVGYGF